MGRWKDRKIRLSAGPDYDALFEQLEQAVTQYRNHRIVEGMRVVVAALPVLDTDAQPACLCITQVGAAPDLEIFLCTRSRGRTFI